MDSPNAGVLVVVAAVGALVGWLIGKGKGKGVAGFWLGLLLGFIGWIIVAGMKPSPEVAARRLAEGQSAPGHAQQYPTSYSAASTASPAGWHPDPRGRFEQRYWDGAAWTQHVSTRGLTSVDPL